MIRIALLVCPQTVCSSLAMADDAFRLANTLAGEALFEVLRVSRDGQPVDLGMASIRVDGDLALAAGARLVMLPATGSAVERSIAGNTELLAWLARRPATQQVASLCSSAFLLGAAGLLDGRRATTHWALAGAFRQRFPQVRLQPDELLTEDGNLFCSGGAQAGLDLCLHLIAWHGGDWLAQRVAGALVFDRERGRQSRFTRCCRTCRETRSSARCWPGCNATTPSPSTSRAWPNARTARPAPCCGASAPPPA